MGRSEGFDVGERPSLRRVLPFLAEESFDERFEFGVARLLAPLTPDVMPR